MKTKGFIAYHGREYQVTPGLLRTLEKSPGGSRDAFLYHLLRAEGYSAAELDRPALDAPPQARQLTLFTENSPWTSR